MIFEFTYTMRNKYDIRVHVLSRPSGHFLGRKARAPNTEAALSAESHRVVGPRRPIWQLTASPCGLIVISFCSRHTCSDF